jgi:hypothetical protein
VEEQRKQLEEQEKQVALLRDRIALLEGTAGDQERTSTKQGGSSVDDFSIKVCPRFWGVLPIPMCAEDVFCACACGLG